MPDHALLRLLFLALQQTRVITHVGDDFLTEHGTIWLRACFHEILK